MKEGCVLKLSRPSELIDKNMHIYNIQEITPNQIFQEIILNQILNE